MRQRRPLPRQIPDVHARGDEPLVVRALVRLSPCVDVDPLRLGDAEAPRLGHRTHDPGRRSVDVVVRDHVLRIREPDPTVCTLRGRDLLLG